MRVLGLDPGGKTGVCLYDTENPLEPFFLEVEGGVRGFSAWWKGQRLSEGAQLVCESFRLDDRTKQPDLSPVEIIGFLKAEGIPITYQMPSKGKLKVTNAILKRAGIYPKRGQVKGGHVVDAERHALEYLVTKRHRPTIELLWPKEL